MPAPCSLERVNDFAQMLARAGNSDQGISPFAHPSRRLGADRGAHQQWPRGRPHEMRAS
ncbi:MAG: hypothetical protein M3478_02445 [Planctomycetota bacterium]|nr:hypothetical protein [Planctomycetota bacterium]